MKEKYLPIGSVVSLENSTKKVMIIGYLPLSQENELYDYNGCTFPEGVLDVTKTLAFNHEKIKEINHLGFDNEESKNFNQQISLIRKMYEEKNKKNE